MEINHSKNTDLKPKETSILQTVCGYFVQENESEVMTGFYMKLCMFYIYAAPMDTRLHCM